MGLLLRCFRQLGRFLVLGPLILTKPESSPLQPDRTCEWHGCEGRCAFDPGYCCNCQFCPKGCFPAASKVSLENGKSVTMSELQVGDKVKTGKALTVFFNI